MAHYSINPAARLGGKLLNDLRSYRQAREELKLMLLSMNEMDVATIESEFGFAVGEGDEGKAEFEAMIGKVTTDAQVSGVNAAHDACFARLL